MTEFTNELIHESSPYLLQHAYNPVRWHAWSDNNLATAKKQGKPLLISIGYSSCHWCHVMEKESFEDAAVADIMNEYFYCIKVDREERPDLDQLYMTAANIILGSGGWPLNCFALPDGRPFHAGTYYPREAWINLLKVVHDRFENQRGKLEDYSLKLVKGIQLQETAISDNTVEHPNPEILQEMLNKWMPSWDNCEGGIIGAPKFPMPSIYRFLLNYTFKYPDPVIAGFIQTSLQKMGQGGIFDQIGGGFSRYAVDEYWRIPHFEKMLYDNAQLIHIYAEAYRAYHIDLYLDVIKKTLHWLKTEMRDDSGLFYSGLDADSEGIEGKYYVWTEDELKNVLKDDYPLTEAYYLIGTKALWEKGQNILMQVQDKENIATLFQMDVQTLEQNISWINKKLLAIRSKRTKPALDYKCLSSWNGMLLSAFCAMYWVENNKDVRKLAMELADALIELQISPEGIRHSYAKGKSTIEGLLEDYAFVADGLLNLYECTGIKKYYKQALKLLEQAVKLFYNENKGFFYSSASKDLVVSPVEIYDNVIPSTNAMMCSVLHKAGLLEGNTKYLTIAASLLGKVQKNIKQYPSGHSYWSLCLLQSDKDFYEVVIIGNEAEEKAIELQSHYLPNAFIVFSKTESDIPIFKNRFIKDKTLFYICKKGLCKQPVEEIKDALTLLY